VLGKTPKFYSRLLLAKPDQLIGWGRRWSGQRAVEMAARLGCGYVLLEDGFLRSYRREDAARAMVMDDLGIYYDAQQPSRLEALIAQPLSEAQAARAKAIMAGWRRLGLSKYNAAPEFRGDLPKKYVLVVDQVAGDLSIRGGLADRGSFQTMLRAALAENPDTQIIIKTHPDVMTRNGAGHFGPTDIAGQPRIRLLAENCHPARLLAGAQKVYCVTSQMGFEALLWGRPVRCFGMPFYAGWGLTEDHISTPIRRSAACLEQLIHAALVGYATYFDAAGSATCTVETVMAEIGKRRTQLAGDPASVYAYGFSRWKRQFLRAFLPSTKVRFMRPGQRAPAGGAVAIWGAEPLPLGAKPEHVLRIEDGFLRSSGLGADLVAPLSWVVDDLGIYYNSQAPCRLEKLLQTHEFDAALLARAAALRHRIIADKISKYNLTTGQWVRPAAAKQVILVPGQVESDASIRLGAGAVCKNLALLQAVRLANPQAYIVYKPHPDVVAGLRRAGMGDAGAAQYCDEIVQDADAIAMIEQVDAVHTMTSLLGFEALIRGVAVRCYGQPFYAGWGLTEDEPTHPRRQRRLSLDALVAGALVLYPRYARADNRALTSPEETVATLGRWHASGPSRAGHWHKAKRAILRFWAQSWFKRNA